MPAVEVAGDDHRGEEGFVGGLHVGFPGLDDAVLHPGHQAVVHRDHAVRLAALDDRPDVRDLAAADRVGQRFMGEQNLMHRAAAVRNPLAEELGYHAGETAR